MCHQKYLKFVTEKYIFQILCVMFQLSLLNFVGSKQKMIQRRTVKELKHLKTHPKSSPFRKEHTSKKIFPCLQFRSRGRKVSERHRRNFKPNACTQKCRGLSSKGDYSPYPLNLSKSWKTYWQTECITSHVEVNTILSNLSTAWSIFVADIVG